MNRSTAFFAAALISPLIATAAVAQADRLPPWRTHLMPWLTHAGQPRPWRADTRLAPFNESGYPDDFQVYFAPSEPHSRAELMWVTITAYDPASDLYLGILINQPDSIRDVTLGENVVFRMSVADRGPAALRVNGRFDEAGWPPTAAPQFFTTLREGIRAYRNGHDGHVMPEIEHCISVLTPLMEYAPTNARKDELFVGHFVLGRCLAEQYATDRSIAQFRAAIALDSADVDSHMALLAELSVTTHARAGEVTPSDQRRWDQEFMGELAIDRGLARSDPDVDQILALLFRPSSDRLRDSMPPAEFARQQRIGFSIFRWKRR
jgi:hypothetical protein